MRKLKCPDLKCFESELAWHLSIMLARDGDSDRAIVRKLREAGYPKAIIKEATCAAEREIARQRRKLAAKVARAAIRKAQSSDGGFNIPTVATVPADMAGGLGTSP